MKKRKELNALIGLGDSKRKKTKKGSGHRLLRTEPPGSESESSSEDDEFTNLSSAGVFRKSYTQCCSICYPLCVFIILAACVMACAGLIWMQIALKEDLDSLKEKLRTMESSQKASSHEIPKLGEELKAKQRMLEDMENGDRGLNKLWSNLTEINRKISTLDSAVNHLKANIKSASDLISLPTTVEELQKSVATIGSTLTSVQHDVKMIQTFIEDQKKGEDKQKTLTDSPLAVDHDESSRNLNEGTETSGNSGPTQPSGSHPTRHPRFLTKSRAKRENSPIRQRLTFPGVSSVEDLEKLLQARLGYISEGVSYEDLRKIFGPSTPDAHLLQPYDVDRDHRYTLDELQAAIAL
ncbi:EF-hand calcium-binding domain-containing protein 14 [Colossoma macropomum]|uniref:EF-hand calcium-binding domain-containing protein 14 n=1 Tax=Colossoma macropomum TaxID=42526 RepID=UPI0018655AE9|nr:EF-hand calcium-binding domain-containing protein 14 [Colossoma macropomum]